MDEFPILNEAVKKMVPPYKLTVCFQKEKQNDLYILKKQGLIKCEITNVQVDIVIKVTEPFFENLVKGKVSLYSLIKSNEVTVKGSYRHILKLDAILYLRNII
ncbi:hypothetical protein LC087_10440 [Bacillus carboniphilus]|uniref:SCP2 domain-containing protein n=1 Tax=Bacillus carboniphilus TaxID=86663 RepID=A0ABY9JS71_9BACI|nr:hypothetical protein [Bacillus carboniphilus]WLR41338.1 hypothetical protein LC087_10440 [Bacillus carboniphilus]